MTITTTPQRDPQCSPRTDSELFEVGGGAERAARVGQGEHPLLAAELRAGPVRALSLWQPWASWVADGRKLVENRSWPPPSDLVCGLMLVHATRKVDPDANGVCERFGMPLTYGPLGAVLGVVRVMGAVRTEGLLLVPAVRGAWRIDRAAPPSHPHVSEVTESRWFFGPWGWLLKDATPLARPVPARGAQRLWTPSRELVELVAAEMEASGASRRRPPGRPPARRGEGAL